MKKAICCIIISVTFLFDVAAQPIPHGKPCNIFGSVHYINGKATVIIKGIYTDLFKYVLDGGFKNLEKEGKLHYADYFDKHGEGGAIAFAPENCNYEYSAAISNKADVRPFKLGQIIYLTCTIFEGNNNTPLFVVDKVSSKATDQPKKQNIKLLTYIKSKYINVEGGCGYFSDDASFLFGAMKCLLVITPRNLAFIQTADNKHVFFSLKKRVTNDNGYVETYTNSNSWLELNINKIITRKSTSSLRYGRLTVNINHTQTTFNVSGFDEEADQYNNPNY